VKFEKADAATQGGYAFKTIGAYERWLNEGGEDGARQLAVLRLLGLFDRPADAGCMAALRNKPVIADLTEPLVGLADEDWNLTLSSLSECGLVSLQIDQSEIGNRQSTIDAHPLIREYFAKQLREKKPESWRGAHRRLYEHLCKTTSDQKPEPTLEDLQPLYQAIAHGCQAGMQQDAFENVYVARILRDNEYYTLKKLGIYGSDLGAVACFFEMPWSRLISNLSEVAQARLPNQAAFYLRSLGRLVEATQPMRIGLATDVAQENWKNAAISAENLSELELTMGEVVRSTLDAEAGVKYADKSGEEIERQDNRVVHGDALHQAGRRTRRRLSSARLNKYKPSASPNTRCFIRCAVSTIATCFSPLPSAPHGERFWSAAASGSATTLWIWKSAMWGKSKCRHRFGLPTRFKLAASSPSARRGRSSGTNREQKPPSSTSEYSTSCWASSRSTRRF
jgi:hypothetical protein